MTRQMTLSAADEKTLRDALGGDYGGPSISVEGDDFILYSWGDAPVGTETLARGKTLAKLAASIRSPVTRGDTVSWVIPTEAKRGVEFRVRKANGRYHASKCVSVDHRPAGGVGQGEFGESWLAHFTDGTVLSFNARGRLGAHWRVVAEPFEKEEGK